MLLIVFVMIGGYVFYCIVNMQFSCIQQDNKLVLMMVWVKEVLIVYVVIDSECFGSLFCFDLVIDNVGFNNFLGDGKIDMFMVN